MREADAAVAASEQQQLNREVWSTGDFAEGWYASRILRPVEAILLVRYREKFTGRVLELGCGAGRVTGYFVQVGATVLGLDISPRMVEYCRQRYPGGQYRVGDLAQLDGLEREAYDVVFLGNNLLDVFDDAERRRTLLELKTLLKPTGLLVMSSHNRARAACVLTPLKAVGGAGIVEGAHRLRRLPRWLVNSRRARRHAHSTERYAIINDEAHDFRLLHYYTTRDDQERQFNELGYELLDCLDAEGQTVAAGQAAAHEGELHYVARLSPAPAEAERSSGGPDRAARLRSRE